MYQQTMKEKYLYKYISFIESLSTYVTLYLDILLFDKRRYFIQI